VSKVLLVTSRFPYGNSEQFLEHELPYWGKEELKILPLMSDSETERACGFCFSDKFNISRLSRSEKIVSALYISCDMEFWKELLFIVSRCKFKSFRPLLIYTILSNRLYLKINKAKAELKRAEVVYCYWSNWSLRAFAMAKRRIPNLSFKLITRSHRVDLYAYAMPGGYMPFRHRFYRQVDAYYPISEDGKRYLSKNYGVPADKIKIHRLGVPKKMVSDPGAEPIRDGIKLISVSYAKRVKRLDRIVDAIALIHRKCPETKVSWVHIGGGELLPEIQKYAVSQGVECEWLGMQSNEFVLKYLSKAQRAIFVNVSDSEGVPVSIMEALSFGIPVVATDVGGTGELVSKRVGRLIKAPFEIEEIADGLISVYENYPSPRELEDVYMAKCSGKNYESFIDDILSMKSNY